MKFHPALFGLIFAVAALSLVLVPQALTAQTEGAHQQQPATAAFLRQAGAAKKIIIGAAADPRHLDEKDYASTLAEQFSQLEPENQMKFALIHPRPGSAASSFDFAPADQLVAFAEAHKIKVRGHCFVWHRQVADWVTAGIKNHEYSPAALNKILHDHIDAVAKHYAGKVWAWDVVNEAFNGDGTMRSTVWYDEPGIGFAGQGTRYIEEAFRWAHAADPNAKLFYNDYDTEAINAKSDAIYAMAKDFRSRGVPLDGIGFQAHINLKFDDPEKLESFAANLKRFSDLGLEIHITELDIALDDDTPASLKKQGFVPQGNGNLCTESELPCASDLGIHRQVFVDTPLQQRQARLGAALRCCLSQKTGLRFNLQRPGIEVNSPVSYAFKQFRP